MYGGGYGVMYSYIACAKALNAHNLPLLIHKIKREQ